MTSTAPAAALAMTSLMQAHRSIRNYRPDPIDPALVDAVLDNALHGSSSSGNLNLMSVVKTQDPVRKARLFELHSEQPMVLQAPLVLTFCADTFRSRRWLAQRGARLGFADFMSYHVAAFDAVILAQTAALAFEAHGLGICYMGTTLFQMGAIAEFLHLPENCVPITSLVVGWPAEAPTQRDRLPPAAWVHDETYRQPTAADIDAQFGERDRRGWARYRSMGEETVRSMEAQGITSLAQFYTSKIKYDPDRFAEFSSHLCEVLSARGFMP